VLRASEEIKAHHDTPQKI